MKRYISLLLSLIILLGTVFATNISAAMNSDGNWVPDGNNSWDALSRDGVVARFAVGADPHFSSFNTEAKQTYLFDALKQIGGVDAYLIAGDLTHNGRESEYTALINCINKYTKKNDNNKNAYGNIVGTTIFSMGNHEYKEGDEKRFTDHTGQAPCDLYFVNGIPVITLSPDTNIPERAEEGTLKGNNYDNRYDFLKKAYDEIDATGYDGLIILIAHHRTKPDGSENDYYSAETIELMRTHPNTMIFTGHSHTWIWNTSDFVFQDAGFTHVRAGSLANHYSGLGDAAINPSTGENYRPLEIAGDSNCSFVLVDILENGNAVLRRIDLAKGKYMFEDYPITIRPNVLTDYLRTPSENSFAEGAAKPSFTDSAVVTAQVINGGKSLKVSFPEALPASAHPKDFVVFYRIRVRNVKSGEYLTSGGKEFLKVINYRGLVDEGHDWSVIINGLEWNTTYDVEVKAVSAYGLESKWISVPAAVKNGSYSSSYPAKAIFNFDASYGNVNDTEGHALLGAPSYESVLTDNGQGAVLLKAAADDKAFSYEFTESDHESVRDSFSLECYFSSSDIITPQAIFGGWDATRLGMKVKDGSVHLWLKMENSAEASESNLVLSAPISADTWTHVTAVYDGAKLKLYVNGELAAEREDELTSGLKIISYDADETGGEKLTRRFYIGAGGHMGDPYKQAVSDGTKINKVTLYSGAMTAYDVKLACRQAVSRLSFEDIPESHWATYYIEYACAAGLMNGMSQYEFSPEGITTRAQLAQTLYNLSGRPEHDAAVLPFTDVAEGAWYNDAVTWAYENGLVKGISETTFDPDSPVTREQMAVFFYRYYVSYLKLSVDGAGDISLFPDYASVSDYAKEALIWANGAGIVKGRLEGGVDYLCPTDTAKRCEIAKILTLFTKLY